MICSKCTATNPAAQKFCGQCGSPVPGTPALLPGKQRLSRRQVTVLFCDLAGSTALAGQLDPEDLLDVLSAYSDVVRQTALRFGGHVARAEGDGIDLYFGYPQAGEDDAVRAIHAGLAIIDGLKQLPQHAATGLLLQARIGIATGRVAVDMHGPVAIAGITPNLAARIQSVIEPGQLAVAPGTRRIAGTQFIYEDLGSFVLKGFAEPVPVARVSGALSLDSRSAWRGRSGTQMVARAAELSALMECWKKTRAGVSAGALIVAEAGLGKSRLLDAFDQRLVSPHHTIRLQCSPFYVNSALQPFIQYLQQAAGLQREDAALLQLQKLEALLARAGIAGAVDKNLFAELLGIDAAGCYDVAKLPPPLQLQLTQEVLLRYFIGVGSASGQADGKNPPLLLALEDMHWIDPTSLELVDALLAKAGLPLCLVMTARPEFLAAFNAGTDLAIIHLQRLDETAARAIAANMMKTRPLPAAVIDTIIKKSDGVPLYIEEMTRMILDGQSAREGAGHPEDRIPDTLMDLLMGNLDRLGEEKWLAQVAAVIGREFSRDLLLAAAEMESTVIGVALEKMLAAALIVPSAGDNTSFLFRHALMEEAAYDSIPLKARASLHGRLAAILVRDCAERVDRQPELAAHHFTRAGSWLDASHYWLLAGQRALGRGTPREAAAHLQAGVAALTHVPDSLARSVSELDLLSVLGPTTMVMTGPGSALFGDVQKRAFALCHRIPGAPRQFPVTYGLCLFHWGRAELDIAGELSGQLLDAAAARPGEDELIMAASNMSGMISFHGGDTLRARAHLERSIACYQPERDAALYPVYLMDFGVFGRFYLALATFVAGDAERARQHAQDAYELAGRLQQPHTFGFALLASFMVAAWRDEPEPARKFAEQCIQFSSAHGFPEFVAMARIVRGWSRVRTRKTDADVAEGIEDMEAGIAGWQATGFENWQPWFVSLKVQALVLQQRCRQALAEIGQQLERMDRNGENQFRSLLLAEKAAILARTPETMALAEPIFDEALRVASAQGALAWVQRIEAGRNVARKNASGFGETTAALHADRSLQPG